MIEEAAEQMTGLLDELGTAARIQAGSWEPGAARGDTLELASSDDDASTPSATARGRDGSRRRRSRLQALAIAAIRHGPVDQVTWTVRGRALELAPITDAASPVVTGDELRDLGSLVARYVLEELGGTLELARRDAARSGLASRSRSQPWNAASSGSAPSSSRPCSSRPEATPRCTDSTSAVSSRPTWSSKAKNSVEPASSTPGAKK